jgi:hypothetical protein
LSNFIWESSEKLIHALLITQISKNDYRDFWTFSGISLGESGHEASSYQFFISLQILFSRLLNYLFWQLRGRRVFLPLDGKKVIP